MGIKPPKKVAKERSWVGAEGNSLEACREELQEEGAVVALRTDGLPIHTIVMNQMINVSNN
jgi:hypothetical protein